MAGPHWTKPKVPGKTFAFTGTLQFANREDLAARIQAEGGTVVAAVSAKLHYLVVGPTQTGTPSSALKKAQRLNRDNARIESLNEVQLAELLLPTPDEVLAMLKGGPEGWTFLAQLLPRRRPGVFPRVDLSGRDLRSLSIQGDKHNELNLAEIVFDRADFRGATLRSVRLAGVSGARFDGADLRGSYLSRCQDCSFKGVDLHEGSVGNAQRCVFDRARVTDGTFSGDNQECKARRVDLTGTRLNPADLSSSDYAGAKLRVRVASYTTGRDSVFKNADFHGAELEESHFERSDFTGADLGEAQLRKSDFTGATLARTRLGRADLRDTILADADLRGADLQEANLCGADLRGARIDRANFRGAALIGARLDGLDLSKARSLAVEQARGGAIGPNIRELARVAAASRKFDARAEVEDKGGHGLLSAQGNHHSGRFYAGGYASFRPTSGGSIGRPVDGDTIETVMLNLARCWPSGRLKLGSIEVKATGCPLKGKELLQLATAAWCEAVGIEVLSPAGFDRAEADKEAALKQLHEEALEELHSGVTGVKKWNARPREVRRAAGRFRREDFSGHNLRAANFEWLDCEGAVFDGADLRKAQFHRGRLNKATFRSANLDQGCIAGCKASDTEFEGATLTGCNLRNNNLRRANFADADLEGSDLSFSDLCGADLSSGNLTGVGWSRASFDELTRFPTGFVIPEEMRWRGKSPDPRFAGKVRRKGT